jgi:hypothetical protein
VPVPPVPAAPACVVPTKLDVIAARKAEGTFVGFSLDGATVAWRVPSGKAAAVVVYKTESHDVVSKVELDPKAVAWSYDGSRQILVEGGKVLVKDKDQAPVPVEGAEPGAADGVEPRASLSHDGRFLVMRDQHAVFDLVDKKKLELKALPFAGGSDPNYWTDATGHFVTVLNSRYQAVDKLTFAPEFAYEMLLTSHDAIVSRDASVVLSVPREPFAQDFVPTFEVTGRLTSKLPLKLKEKERFLASLCPGGNLVAVIAQNALGFYAADTGKQVLKKPLAQVAKTKITLAKEGDVLQLSPAGNVLLLKAGADELLLRLAR